MGQETEMSSTLGWSSTHRTASRSLGSATKRTSIPRRRANRGTNGSLMHAVQPSMSGSR